MNNLSSRCCRISGVFPNKTVSSDIMVGSVLSYASEIWGFHLAHDIGVIHNRLCRFALKIGQNVPTAFLYGELGHMPMYISRRFRITFDNTKIKIFLMIKLYLNISINTQFFTIVNRC
jgi:hypothetical protein